MDKSANKIPHLPQLNKIEKKLINRGALTTAVPSNDLSNYSQSSNTIGINYALQTKHLNMKSMNQLFSNFKFKSKSLLKLNLNR
jgi:hypothetical protein